MGMKAMLLAAGRGERMKSLTDHLPKPLISVGSKTLIEHNLERLGRVGIREVVINVSYRGHQIMDYIGDGRRFGVCVTYSMEPNSPLGTGGGILKALPFFESQPFLVLNSDVWTDYPFQELLKEGSASDAHLVLVDNPDFHAEGDYCLLKSSKLGLQGTSKLTYAGFGVIHPRLFASCHPGYFSYIPLIEQAIQRSSVTGCCYKGVWFNVGTEKELNALKTMLSTQD